MELSWEWEGADLFDDVNTVENAEVDTTFYCSCSCTVDILMDPAEGIVGKLSSTCTSRLVGRESFL